MHARLRILCNEDDWRAGAMRGPRRMPAQTLRLLFFLWLLGLPFAIVGMDGMTRRW
jgi:hypothetical protein